MTDPISALGADSPAINRPSVVGEGKAARVAQPKPQGNAEGMAHSRQPADLHLDPEKMRQEVQEAIKKLNEQMTKNSYNLNFSVDDTTNFVVVQVKNVQSGEVIRQIPNETVLRVAHDLEAVKGLLRDQAA
ncbi:MAG: hypothetical protein RI949_502 [Pseudomonadota bacterium]